MAAIYTAKFASSVVMVSKLELLKKRIRSRTQWGFEERSLASFFNGYQQTLLPLFFFTLTTCYMCFAENHEICE